MPGKIPVKEVEHRFMVKFGTWPPDLSALSGLGFDSVSTTKSKITIKKSQSTDIAGHPHLFCKIELEKNSATLIYSVPPEADSKIRQMQAAALFLRVMSLMQNLQIPAQDFAALSLPALETASKVATTDYGSLSKKYNDLRHEASDTALKSARLSASSEEAASTMLGLERQLAASEARIKKLEAVSDTALREAVLEWINAHHGAFNAAAFASSAKIPLTRTEEGLEMLLKTGSLRRVGSSFSTEHVEGRGMFQEQAKGPLQPLKNLAGSAVSSVHKAFSPAKK
ncbi:MAG: hypothetical protein NTV88_02565 [Candidatus Micrarchaeota archaeon]|nr:hypothetical protein [Candidatus Micrarchaeota archaeon]